MKTQPKTGITKLEIRTLIKQEIAKLKKIHEAVDKSCIESSLILSELENERQDPRNNWKQYVDSSSVHHLEI